MSGATTKQPTRNCPATPNATKQTKPEDPSGKKRIQEKPTVAQMYPKPTVAGNDPSKN